jgi:branched-chain amino acid transport system substrate-binding protein
MIRIVIDEWLPRGRLAALGLLLCTLSAGCSDRRTPAAERTRRAAGSGDIVVAAVWPWQGRAELRYGQGMDLAIEEVNAGGGIKGRRLVVQKHDDHESLDEGTMTAQRIASDPSVMAVIGHLQSYVTLPAAAIYDLAGLVLVAPTATDPTLTTQGYRRVFRATFSDRDSGYQLAEFTRARFRRVTICYIRNTYGRNLANAFEERAGELGLAIAARRSYDPGGQVTMRTFEAMVNEWKGLDIDAVFLAGEVPSAAMFVVQARAGGLDVPIIGGDAMGAPVLMSVAREAAEGMVVASFFHPDEPRPEVQAFRAAFEKRFSISPDAGAALGYDAVHLLARGMRHAGTPAPDAVARALHELPAWSGVTGSIQFDEHGAARAKRAVMTTVQRGRFTFLDSGARLSVGNGQP